MSIISILITLLILTAVVVVHEYGHYIYAKKANVLVEEFAIGLGPILYKRQGKETLFTIRAIPLGGFCKMYGEDSAESGDRAFNNKTKTQRTKIISAGAIFNFILAFFIFWIIAMMTGYATPTVAYIEPGYPAEQAGLEVGDTIVKMNGERIYIFEDIKFEMYQNGSEEIELVVKNEDGKKETLYVTPVQAENGSYIMGFKPEIHTGFLNDTEEDDYEPGNLIQAAYYSFFEMFFNVKATIYGLFQLITGGLSLDAVAGPIGVATAVEVVYEETSAYGFIVTLLAVLEFIALISASVGIFNLLPFPALDGGRLLFILIELIRGKPVSAEKESLVHVIGFLVLAIFGIIVIFNDILRLFGM